MVQLIYLMNIKQLENMFPEYSFKQDGNYLQIFKKEEILNFTSIDLRKNKTEEQIINDINNIGVDLYE